MLVLQSVLKLFVLLLAHADAHEICLVQSRRMPALQLHTLTRLRLIF